MPILPQANKASQVLDFNGDDDQLILSAQATARNLIVDPSKLIPVPKYLLRSWYGFLTASEIALIIGIRQAGFVIKAKESIFARRKVSNSHISYWSGLKRKRVSKLIIDGANTYLKWFVVNSDSVIDRGLTNEYDIRINYPLTPFDLAAVRSAVEKYISDWIEQNPDGRLVDFIAFIENKIEDQGVDGFYSDKYLLPQGTKYSSVQSIFSTHFGNVNLQDADACDDFEAKFTKPQDTFTISHYFVKHWLPEMGVTTNFIYLCLLRLKSYKSEKLGHLYFKSKNALAEFLKADRRTIYQLLADIESGISPLASFIKVVSSDKGLELTISMIDPVHPKHYSEYTRLYSQLISNVDKEELIFDENNCDVWEVPTSKSENPCKYSYSMPVVVQKSGTSGEQSHALYVQKDGTSSDSPNVEHVQKSGTSEIHDVQKDGTSSEGVHFGDSVCVQKSDTLGHRRIFHKYKKRALPVHSSDTTVQNGDSPVQKNDTTIKLINKGFNNLSINKQQLHADDSSNNFDKQQLGGSVVVVNGWDINKILDIGGIPLYNNQRQELLKLCAVNHKVARDFVARWLFACSRRQMAGEEKGVGQPEWMALKQYNQKTQQIFLDLADLPPTELFERYISPNAVWGSAHPQLGEAINSLRKKEFDKTLHNFISLETEPEPSDENKVDIVNGDTKENYSIPYVISNIWSHIVYEVGDELSEKFFEEYIQTLKLVYIEGEDLNKTVKIVAQSKDQMDWVVIRYKDLIEHKYRMESMDRTLQIEFVVNDP